MRELPEMNWIVWEHRPESRGGDWPIAMVEIFSDALRIARHHAGHGIFTYTVQPNPAREHDLYPPSVVDFMSANGKIIATERNTGYDYSNLD